jgi:hypothetical protein
LTVWLTFTRWCGFGRDRGLFPEIRAGFIRFGWVKGVLKDKLDAALATLGWRE